MTRQPFAPEEPQTHEHEYETEAPAPDAPPAAGGGVSPLLVIFLLSGMMGLLAAAVMFINNEPQTPDGPLSFSQRAVVFTPVPMRSLENWQAEDFELSSLAGGELRLSDYAGRMVFINFWRTDCAPCVRELPAFKEFMAQQGADGAVVLAVNQGENAEDIRRFLTDLGIDYRVDFPVLLDDNQVMGELYPYQFLPTTYVINSEGRVQNFRIGEVTAAELYSYLETDPARG